MADRRDGYGAGGQDYPYGSAGDFDFGSYFDTFWLDVKDNAADISFVSDPDVGAWVDQSGSNTVEDGALNPPSFAGSDGDGVVFATNEGLQIAVAAALNHQYFYLFVDCDPTAITTLQYLLSLTGGGHALYLCHTTIAARPGLFDGSGFRTLPTAAATTGRQKLTFIVDFGAANLLTVRRDSVQLETAGSVAGTGNVGGGSARIGQNPTTGSAYFNGAIHHMIVGGSDTALSSADLSAIEAAL